MQYIFDWEKPGTPKHLEITQLMTNVHDKVKPLFGLDTGGFSFQPRDKFKPLQAADILAWQMNAYMPKIYPRAETEEDLKKLHPGFLALRADQEVTLGFYTQSNLQAWLDQVIEFEATQGIII